MNTVNLANFADYLENALFDAIFSLDLDCEVDVRANLKNGVIDIHLNANNNKFMYFVQFKNGVLVVRINGEIKEAYFECEHVITDNIEATAFFILNLCDLAKSTEFLPIE